jgi:small GTP-binding protein
MEKSPKYVFKVVVVGDSGVGKTSLFRRLLHENFSKEMHTTIGAECGTKTLLVDGTPVMVQLWDTVTTS